MKDEAKEPNRDPFAGPALASQPTLSRFENAVGRRELLRMGLELADLMRQLARAVGATSRAASEFPLGV